MSSKLKGKMFGELEELIMEALWKLGSGTVRDIYNLVTKKRELAYTTVMTVMTRLVSKKILCRKELPDGSYLYKPRTSREDLYAKTSRAFLGEIFKKFGTVAVAQFIDILEDIKPDELKKLRKIIDK